MAPISKPTVGQPGWNTAVDAAIDKVNAHDQNPIVAAAVDTAGAAVGQLLAVTQASPLSFELVDTAEITPGDIGVAPKITGHSGDAAIQVNSEATIISPEIVGFSGIGIEVTAGAQVHLPAGARIDGLAVAGTTGVVLRGTGSRITALRVLNVDVGLNRTSGASDNTWSATYTNCATTEILG